MIIIVPLNGKPAQQFKNYEELFEYLIAMQQAKEVDGNKDWSFTVHSQKQARILYANCKEPCEAVQEAFAANLPLIEIVAGDAKRPLYIVLTPNVNMEYLKRKWCVDYCTYHHVLVREC